MENILDSQVIFRKKNYKKILAMFLTYIFTIYNDAIIILSA
jgi:hypothetical protein